MMSKLEETNSIHQDNSVNENDQGHRQADPLVASTHSSIDARVV